ncbi:MAG: helix-turn-helix domain-containing protein [Proteobacteria bacterium]|nr:helix-turn-helix domain-containing protein [Pseudomonadota bacterium]
MTTNTNRHTHKDKGKDKGKGKENHQKTPNISQLAHKTSPISMTPKEQEMWDRARVIINTPDAKPPVVSLQASSAASDAGNTGDESIEAKEAIENCQESAQVDVSADTTNTDTTTTHLNLEPSTTDNQDTLETANSLEKTALFSQWLNELIDNSSLSREDISKTTKIPLQHIYALCSGDISKLPYKALARGFMQSIAPLITPYPEPLLATYCACYNSSQTMLDPLKPVSRLYTYSFSNWLKHSLLPYLGSTTQPLRGRLRGPFLSKIPHKPLMLAFLTLAILTSFIYIRYIRSPLNIHDNFSSSFSTPLLPDLGAVHSSSPETAEPALEEPIPTDTLTHIAAEDTTTASTQPEVEQTLRMEVYKPMEMIQVLDGKRLRRYLTKGEYIITFKKKAHLTLGNLTSLKLWYNGNEVGTLGKANEVKTFSFIKAQDT